jgi:hypothetical protein
MEQELEKVVSEQLYRIREDAWLSACEWLISLKQDEKADCKKAFEEYINSLTL